MRATAGTLCSPTGRAVSTALPGSQGRGQVPSWQQRGRPWFTTERRDTSVTRVRSSRRHGEKLFQPHLLPPVCMSVCLIFQLDDTECTSSVSPTVCLVRDAVNVSVVASVHCANTPIQLNAKPSKLFLKVCCRWHSRYSRPEARMRA